MARKEYIVTIGGLEHTMLLDDVDVARYGKNLKPAPEVKAVKPENKARQPQNKATK